MAIQRTVNSAERYQTFIAQTGIDLTQPLNQEKLQIVQDIINKDKKILVSEDVGDAGYFIEMLTETVSRMSLVAMALATKVRFPANIFTLEKLPQNINFEETVEITKRHQIVKISNKGPAEWHVGHSGVFQQTKRFPWYTAQREQVAIKRTCSWPPSNLEATTQKQLSISEKIVFSIPAHPNIVQVYGELPPSGQTCRGLVMEYLPLGNLYEKKLQNKEDNRAFSFDDMMSFAQQVVSALLHLHSHGVLHGNINPRKILMKNEQTIQLVGSNRSCLLSEIVSKDSQRAAFLKIIQGDPCYFPPEYFIDEPGEQSLSYKADIWALGCLLYELVDPDGRCIANRIIESYKDSLQEGAVGYLLGQCFLTQDDTLQHTITGILNEVVRKQQMAEPLVRLMKLCLQVKATERCTIEQLYARSFA